MAYRAEDKADDIAADIIERTGEISPFRLSYLLYYIQAWHLVWTGRPAFNEEIRANAPGPVVVVIKEKCSGVYTLSEWEDGDADKVSASVKETIAEILDSYGELGNGDLQNLTQSEAPWKVARKGLPYNTIRGPVIKKDMLREYYTRIATDETAKPVTQVF